MSFVNVRLAGIACILFVGYTLPNYVPPLGSFVFDVLALFTWISVCIQWMRPVNLQSVNMTLAALAVVIPMASISLNLIFGRFGAWQQSVMAIFFLLTALCCSLAGRYMVYACHKNQQFQRLAVTTCFALLYAMLAAAVFNAIVAVFQYLKLPLNQFIAAELIDSGRMFGNMRQPNHFALLMVWGILCALGLQISHPIRKPKGAESDFKHRRNTFRHAKQILLVVIVGLLSVGVAMSSSRMGIGLMWMVAAACFLCSSMPRHGRALALFAACTHGIAWLVMITVAENGGLPFFAATRGVSGLATDSRYALWADGISLITQTPGNALRGVGYGLTNFELNNGDFSGLMQSNNMHNIFLQMALDFGLIIAAVWTSVVCLLAWRLIQSCRSAAGCLLLLAVGAIFLHSCLEYPLWYGNFLLPTAFAIGCLVSLSTASETVHWNHTVTASQPKRRASTYLLWTMLLVPVAAAFEYRHVAPMYHFTNDVGLMNRVEEGYRSVWYRYLADYGAFTAVPVTSESAAMHYSLGLRVRAFDYNEQVAFQFMIAAAHLGKWSEAGIILRRLQRLSPKGVFQRVEKLTPSARAVYEELVLREGSKDSSNP